MKRLEFETEKRRKEKKVVLSLRPKEKGNFLSSRLKMSGKFRSKKGFLISTAGNEIPQIDEYVNYLAVLRKMIFEISPGV